MMLSKNNEKASQILLDMNATGGKHLSWKTTYHAVHHESNRCSNLKNVMRNGI